MGEEQQTIWLQWYLVHAQALVAVKRLFNNMLPGNGKEEPTVQKKNQQSF